MHRPFGLLCNANLGLDVPTSHLCGRAVWWLEALGGKPSSTVELWMNDRGVREPRGNTETRTETGRPVSLITGYTPVQCSLLWIARSTGGDDI